MSDIKFSTNSTTSAPQGGSKKAGIIVVVVIVIIAAAIVLFNSFSIVNEGYIGVKYQFGKIVDDTMSPGLNFCIPFVEEIVQIDTREQVYSVVSDAYTSDTQTVNNLQLKMNYCYDPLKLSEIIRNTGISNVEAKLLVPNVAKISKDAIGKVKAEALVQSRAEVTEEIQSTLTEILQPYGITVTAFALENLNFDAAFEESIQAKVIAAQDALKMENKTKERQEEAKQVVIAAQAEADSTLIEAEAQAKSIALIQEQLSTSPNYIEYMKIQNWNGVLPQVISDDVNPFVALDGTSYYDNSVRTAVPSSTNSSDSSASSTTDDSNG